MPYVEYDEVEAICSDCGRIFRSEEALSAHRDEAHSGIVGRTAPTVRSASTSVTCPVCGRRFDSPTTLRAHQARSHPR
jgi:uncharacterized C2H2 Zn-finger protein